MLRELARTQSAVLLSLDDAADWLARVQRAAAESQPGDIHHLLAESGWRSQLVAAAAIVLGGGDEATDAALWRAMDGGSWVAPQLCAAAFLTDAGFEAGAEERLLGVVRRPPKLMGSLVRAYHRLPRPKMAIVAQLRRHDAILAGEEARIGIRGVDAWLDRLPVVCDAAMQQKWRRQPAPAPSGALL